MSKKTIIATILMCASLSTSAQTRAQKEEYIQRMFTKDARCLSLAQYAETVGEALEAGRTEAFVINTDTKSGEWFDRVAKNMIQFVYTMRLDPQNARQMVYMKCKAGDFNPTVEEMAKWVGKR